MKNLHASKPLKSKKKLDKKRSAFELSKQKKGKRAGTLGGETGPDFNITPLCEANTAVGSMFREPSAKHFFRKPFSKRLL
jgi:hypothetical protein